MIVIYHLAVAGTCLTPASATMSLLFRREIVENLPNTEEFQRQIMKKIYNSPSISVLYLNLYTVIIEEKTHTCLFRLLKVALLWVNFVDLKMK